MDEDRKGFTILFLGAKTGLQVSDAKESATVFWKGADFRLYVATRAELAKKKFTKRRDSFRVHLKGSTSRASSEKCLPVDGVEKVVRTAA